MNTHVEGTSLSAGGCAPAAEAEALVAAPHSDGFQHVALLYENELEYLNQISSFVEDGLARDEPAMIAVPGSWITPLRERLAAVAGRVDFADMTRIGRNPGGIMPAIRDFADRHRGRRANYVGEHSWPTRSTGEFLEAAKHDALLNLAFADLPLTVLCPYNAAGLPADTLTLAEQTHPLLARADKHGVSPAYLGVGCVPPPCLAALPEPPAGAQTLRYHNDLRPVRALVGQRATGAGLSLDRAADLVIAVSELAANTLAHTARGGTLRVWATHDEIVCEIRDGGWIADPLAGRHSQPDGSSGGQGLWLVNQVSDLVETRTSLAEGTTIRVHMCRPG